MAIIIQNSLFSFEGLEHYRREGGDDYKNSDHMIKKNNKTKIGSCNFGLF